MTARSSEEPREFSSSSLWIVKVPHMKRATPCQRHIIERVACLHNLWLARQAEVVVGGHDEDFATPSMRV